MNYLNLPKIDLHCHLDGSVRPSTIIDLAKKQNINLPSYDIDQITHLMVAPEDCPDLVDYLKRFDLPLSVMQTKEALEQIAFELFEDAAKENVKYQEVRFGPLLHTQNHLKPDDIFKSVIKGLKKAESLYDIKGGFIFCVLRHMPKSEIIPLIDIAAQYIDDGLVAFDLAGAEPDGFCHEFIQYANYAQKKGFKITIHAGEQGSGQNVYDAIKLLGAQRIGHGIHVPKHIEAYKLVHDNQIALETCPTSNQQTKAVCSIQKHPIYDFYKDNIPVTINTDNRTVSNTTMTKEVEKVMLTFNLSLEDYYKIYKNSVNASFTSSENKRHLLSFIP